MSESGIFKAAVKLAPERRGAYLDSACGANQELRREVDSLLRAHDASGSFLREPATVPPAFEPVREGPGTRVGPYKLLQQIGEGGMGVVYMAEQEQPVRRKVALKIIKPGMDSKQVIARFEAERQALAMMEHVNIARVLDAGETPPAYAGGSPQPYFVMELVHGVPLTRYCDDNKLTPRQRLELFIPVCHAIQHAHQKGIIHRDVKPSNVLVTMYDDRPVPKVIDFGVAKAVEQRLTEKTLFTQYGALVGTFEYMSPEQAEMNAFGVDTRSDIYALGVLLYELLTGTTPLERQRLREAALCEIVRLIKEEEAPRPSTRLSTSGAALATVAQQRGTEPARLARLVKGELDWIVMRCLEKDRTRRYETANALARDVQRYLKDEPVEACPPSAGYRLRKAARKYKKALATAAVFAVLLLGGIAVSSWQAVRATQAEIVARTAEDEAKKAAAKAEAINRFLLADMLGPDESPGRNTKFEHVLKNAAAKVDRAFHEQPEVEAAVRNALGEAYITLGHYNAAKTQLDEALRIRSSILGGEHPETLASMFHLARLAHHQDRREEAQDLARKVLGSRRRVLGDEHEDTIRSMQQLAHYLTWARGRVATDEASSLAEEALQISRRVLGNEHKLTLWLKTTQSGVASRQGDRDKAVALDREVFDTFRRVLGEKHPDTLVAMQNLSLMLSLQGYRTQRDEERTTILAESEKLARRALNISREVLGNEHPGTLWRINRLVRSLETQDRLDEALELAREALPLLRRELGSAHHLTTNAIRNLGTVLHRQGKLKEDPKFLAQAEDLFRELVGIRRNHERELRPELHWALFSWAALLHDKGELNKAEELYREGLSLRGKDDSPEDDVGTYRAQAQLCRILLSKREYPEAEQRLRDILNVYEERYPNFWRYFDIQSMLGVALAGQKKSLPEAEQLLLKGYEGLKVHEAQLPPERRYYLTEALERLVQFYDATGKPDEAAKWRKELEARKEAAKQPAGPLK